MSTKENFVLTDGEKFYDQDKNMVGLGAGKLKVYTNENGARSAARMIKSVALTPVSLEDAKNGKATEMQADSEKALKEGANQAAKETSEEVLAAKEAQEFGAMLENAYGHITDDPKAMEKIHNFTLSPVGKRIDFNANYIRGLLAEYDEATAGIPTPANKQVLIDGINVEQAKLETFKSTLDADTFGYVAMGIRAEIAPMQKELAELPDESKAVFDALFLLPLCGRLFSEKALKPSTRGKSGNGQSWAMGEGQFLAFDYSSTRVCQNGLDLSKLDLVGVQAFVYHPDHENVKDLNIPAKKLAVVNADHILVATIDANLTLGNVLGEAIFEIVRPPIDRVGFVQAISSTGIDAFQSKKSTILSKTAKTVSAEVIRNGLHSELEQAGQNADTEKDHAAIE